jgi:hypothetical protein
MSLSVAFSSRLSIIFYVPSVGAIHYFIVPEQFSSTEEQQQEPACLPNIAMRSDRSM